MAVSINHEHIVKVIHDPFPLTVFLMFYLHANDSATGPPNSAALLVKFASLSSETGIIQNSFAQASN
jgi:hypothetical protein